MQVSSNTSTESLVIGQTQKVNSFTLANSKEFFEILSKNLYSYPIVAVIRETMCNAWDAHIKAGKTEIPIKAYLEDNNIIVEDFGTGIPHEEIQTIYGVFGASTKVHDKTQTGGFGLGCKAPFAITSSFTVQNIYKGIKSIYSCIRNDPDNNNLPTIRTILSAPTTEQEGIKVTIPYSEVLAKTNSYNINQYIIKIAKLGGMRVKGIDSTYEKNDFFFVISDSDLLSSNYSNYFIRYGNVVYPIDSKYVPNSFYTFDNIAFEAEPDTLTIAPSREQLIYDDKTVATLKKFFAKLQDYIYKNYKRIFEYICKEAGHTNIAPDIISLTNIDKEYNHIRDRFVSNVKWNNIKDLTVFNYINNNYSKFKKLRISYKHLYKYFPRNLCNAAKYMNNIYRNTDKLYYYFYKVFKEDFYKVHYLDGEHGAKALVNKIFKDRRRDISFICNKIYLTNTIKGVNKLTGIQVGYVISINKKDKDKKIKQYTDLGFKVEYIENNVKSTSSSIFTKTRKKIRYVYKSYYSTIEANIQNKDIDCYTTNDAHILRELLGRYGRDLFICDHHFNTILKEIFKDMVCVHIKYKKDINECTKLNIPTLGEYIKTYYSKNVDKYLEHRFEKSYVNLLKVVPYFEENIKYALTHFFTYNQFIINILKLKQLLNKKYSFLSRNDLNEFILASIDDFTDKEKVLFYIWLNEKISLMFKESYSLDPETKRLIKKVYLSPLKNVSLENIDFLLEYPESVRKQIFNLLLTRKQNAD